MTAIEPTISTVPQEDKRDSPRPEPPSLRSKVDETSDASFPASDAPAAWTWEVPIEPDLRG
jgi:hypothetical protein